MTKIYSKVLYFKELKNHCSLLTVLVEYVIIVLVICVDIMDNIIAIVPIIVIAIGLIIFTWWVISNRLRKAKINTNDYEKVKLFYENILKMNHPDYDHNCYYAVDFLETIESVCEEFLKGHKNLGQEKTDLIGDLKDSEIINEIKKLKLAFLSSDIKEVLSIVYRYYDERGVWKNEI